jgi:hypothetical protein
MQVIATGKWSKAEKRWKMVVALRRPPGSAPASALKQHEGRPGSPPRHRKNPDR